MWKYIAAGFLFLIGALEIILALSERMREEIMKNSPVQSKLTSPVFLILAGLSAFVMALALIFYDRFL